MCTDFSNMPKDWAVLLLCTIVFSKSSACAIMWVRHSLLANIRHRPFFPLLVLAIAVRRFML